jgi:hypothetical protein
MTRNRIFKTTNMLLLGLFAFAFLSPNALTAQVSTADLLGTVTDSTGAVLSGVAITVTNTQQTSCAS